jgi:glutamine---fructose-6-phosphate transaminase (isomerizing)
MCGIGGIWRHGNSPIGSDQITELLCALEERGNDAAGIAAVTAGELHVLALAEPATRFVTTQDFKDFISEHVEDDKGRSLDCSLVMVHARFATTGSPKDNKNNHPVYAGNAAVVHNGEIYNASKAFEEMKLERKAEVDSDVLRACYDKFGLNKDTTTLLGDKLVGSCAMAVFDGRAPERFVLARSGSPLVLGEANDQLIWASTKLAIHQAARRWHLTKLGFWMQDVASGLKSVSFPENTAWGFGPRGLEWHTKFAPCTTYRKPNYRRVYTEWEQRQQKWAGDKDAHL